MQRSEINFEDLPAPNVVEELDFERLFADRLGLMLGLDEKYEQVLSLESDPLVINFQVNAYKELLLRNRINEVAKSRLLALATQGDLDHLGDFYGVLRAETESDEVFRQRIREQIKASSTAGSRYHYRSRAMEVNPSALRDIAVDSPGGGKVRVSLQFSPEYDFLEENTSLISQLSEKEKAKKIEEKQRELEEQIREYVTSDTVRMLTDQVTVSRAEKVSVDIVATIQLHPTTPQPIYDQIFLDFRAHWEDAAHMGRDISPSWVLSQLHRKGIHHIQLHEPQKVITILPHQVAEIGELRLERLEGGLF